MKAADAAGEEAQVSACVNLKVVVWFIAQFTLITRTAPNKPGSDKSTKLTPINAFN